MARHLSITREIKDWSLVLKLKKSLAYHYSNLKKKKKRRKEEALKKNKKGIALSWKVTSIHWTCFIYLFVYLCFGIGVNRELLLDLIWLLGPIKFSRCHIFRNCKKHIVKVTYQLDLGYVQREYFMTATKVIMILCI